MTPVMVIPPLFNFLITLHLAVKDEPIVLTTSLKGISFHSAYEQMNSPAKGCNTELGTPRSEGSAQAKECLRSAGSLR